MPMERNIKKFVHISDKRQAGYTIVELLVAVGILGIIMIPIANLTADYYRTNELMRFQAFMQTEGRNATKQIVDDLRKTNQASNGAYAIDSVSSSSVAFYSNIDSDSYFEKVRYYISGTNLKKGVIKPAGNPLVYNPANEITSTLSKNVANGSTALFQYYDGTYNGSGSPLASPIDVTKIRMVKIILILDNNLLKGPASLRTEASVSLRNLKDN